MGRHLTRLLVDGYNIIGAWPSLMSVRDGDGIDRARDALIEAMANYSAFKGLSTRLVFDAYAQASQAGEDWITANLAVYYTEYGQTADTYIEKVCAQIYGRPIAHQSRLIVATSDRAQRLTAMGYGAELMSARQLEADVQASELGVKRKQHNQRRRTAGHLFSRLDPQAQAKLAKLRHGGQLQ